ncbi:DUF916 domain-containing protein [Microbacterium sp. H1-D42]|uniref:WxL protein peptidoglycan domain-containing protein n=1 Tax=Microbacterium sp. H1-D42 TaxID=2925844 RepID=UPI001F53714E|nr:DUF916 domain-containing protein [Microbacterium sp. H1-D42]UNK70327.1 DUF916 domain-containing protein [Microbacterium sp. H1-D42]
MRRLVTAVSGFGVAAAIILVPVLASAAVASTGDTGDDAAAPPVTWSVAPADDVGADGRAWVELKLDPGATATDHLVVRNHSEQQVTFDLTAADGYFTDTGRFNILAADETSVGAGTWVDIDESVTVPSHGSAVVPFTVTVPSDATPGDHAAGVAASITTLSNGDGAQLGVNSRVGFRVMTRVAGEVVHGVAVAADGDYSVAWNPFTPGTVRMSVTVENTGNVRLTVDPVIEIAGGERIRPQGTVDGQLLELLPGDLRTVKFEAYESWPLGAIDANLRLDAAMIAPDGSSTPIDTVEQQFTVWALPLSQLIALLALGLIVFGALAGRSRRRRALERMIDDAREAGRRDALTEPAT